MKLAVIGSPIGHSLSPAMHNAALRAMGIEGSYEAIEVLPQNLGMFVTFARRHLDGFNVTVPHKEGIVPLLDVVETAATRARSVNTVDCRGGCLTGLSTDGIGLENGLKEAFDLKTLEGLTVAFLGCGGAVQSAAHHLVSRGVKSILILNRTYAKAEHLAAELLATPSNSKVTALDIQSPQAMESLKTADIIIQGTSLGLKADDPLPFDPAKLPADAFIYDMIYRPTPFQTACRERGLKVADGRGMLLHQGVAALAYWTHRDPPVEVMRAALDAALEGKD